MSTIAARTAGVSPRLRYLPEGLILLVAAIARAWQLDYHSFWFDEIVSLDWAEDGAGYIWQNTFTLLKDKHPPGYYLLLHYWQDLLEPFGLAHHDAALRMSGVLLGVATVLGLLLLVRRLSGATTARLAGLLAALAPILVWYSQELRMFQPATTGLVWAGYCLVRGWQGERWPRRLGWWLGMSAVLLFALYSYLFAAFMLPAAGLTLIGLWVGARGASLASPGRRFVEGAVALGITGLLFVPLAANAWLINDSEGTPGQPFMGFFANLQRQLQLFTVWRAAWPQEVVVAAVVFAALLAAIGLLLPWPRRGDAADAAGAHDHRPGLARWMDQLWLWLWIGVPLLIGNLLLATSDTIFKEDRYFVFLAPFVLWAIARGAVAVGERWRPGLWIAGSAAAVLLLAALPVLWSPALLREDWRAAAQVIAADHQASPGLRSAALSHVDYTNKALKWYLRPLAHEDALPLYFPYTGAVSPEDAGQVIAPPILGIAQEGADTLWLVQSHLEGVDDSRAVQGWLAATYPVLTEQFPAGIQVTAYALRHRYDALPELSPQAVRPDAGLAPNLRLAACEVLTSEVAATDERLHPPSGWVRVRLWWQATGPVDQDYFPSVQMVGPEGVWGERLYRDGEVLRRDPPTQWPAGIFVRDAVDVNLNPVTPPGSYPIVVGLRDASGADVGAKVECGRVAVK